MKRFDNERASEPEREVYPAPRYAWYVVVLLLLTIREPVRQGSRRRAAAGVSPAGAAPPLREVWAYMSGNRVENEHRSPPWVVAPFRSALSKFRQETSVQRPAWTRSAWPRLRSLISCRAPSSPVEDLSSIPSPSTSFVGMGVAD